MDKAIRETKFMMHPSDKPSGKTSDEKDSNICSSWATVDSQFSNTIEHHIIELDDEIIQYVIEVN
jgi:hypothetical protein